MILLVMVAALATAHPASAEPRVPMAGSCGGSTAYPGSPPTDGGYGLESGISAMDRHYEVRVIGRVDPSVSAQLDSGIARINQLTRADLVRGADEAMPPGMNPTIFPVVPGEIDVFTNTWNSGPYAGRYGNWTYEKLHTVGGRGRVSGAVISITMATTGALARPVVWHELGHAVGLDHYFSSYQGACQLMSYGSSNLTDYQVGDRNGLGALAAAGGFGPPVSVPAAAPAPAPAAAPRAGSAPAHRKAASPAAPTGQTPSPDPSAPAATSVAPVAPPTTSVGPTTSLPAPAPSDASAVVGAAAAGVVSAPAGPVPIRHEAEASAAVLLLGLALMHVDRRGRANRGARPLWRRQTQTGTTDVMRALNSSHR